MTRCENEPSRRYAVSSFLSAAENVAEQYQNVRRDLKKMEEESRAVELALKNHNLFIFGLCCTGKMFQLQEDNYINILVPLLLTLDCKVILASGMTSSAARQ